MKSNLEDSNNIGKQSQSKFKDTPTSILSRFVVQGWSFTHHLTIHMTLEYELLMRYTPTQLITYLHKKSLPKLLGRTWTEINC